MNKKEEYLNLLKYYTNEQDIQEFLEKNTEFIPREFVQNHDIHNLMVFRKMKLAESYTSDFFYLSKSSDDWNCVFIEIEKPNSKYFKEGSNEFHGNFRTGLDQIDKWRAWFNIPSNKEYFINQELSFIRNPLKENPCSIKFILVIGRREEYANNAIRRTLVQAKEREDFKIISFDSLAEAYHLRTPLYLAIKKNEYFEIISEEFITDNFLSWTDSSFIRINRNLKEAIIEKYQDDLNKLNNSDQTFPYFKDEIQSKLEKIKKIRIN